jgi:hypothetical protein
MKTRTQRGGLIIKRRKPAKQAFDEFLSNSVISVLTNTVTSGSGVIYKCQLNSHIESPYLTLRRPHKSVNQIIVKLVFVGPEKSSWNGKSFLNAKEIEPIANFQEEIDIQKEIFSKTKGNFDPICPGLVHHDVIQHPLEAVRFLEEIKARSSSDEMTLSTLDDFISNIGENWLGIIGMEMAEGYVPLDKLYSDPRYRVYENMARLRILELAIKTDYSENDFNVGNILVNPSLTGYYKDIPGHVLIIDYGWASKITNANGELDQIKQLFHEGKYVEAIRVFKTLRKRNGSILDYSFIYNWAYFQYDKLKGKTIPKKQYKNPAFIEKHNHDLQELKIAGNLATLERMRISRSNLSKSTKKIKRSFVSSFKPKIHLSV